MMPLEEQMFVAWLPALGVSLRVCLALNRQLRAAGGGGSLAACLALSPWWGQEPFGLGIS